jgi:hypothetical protein
MKYKVFIRVTNRGTPQSNVQLSYEWDSSDRTWPDTTARDGWATSEWAENTEGRKVKIYCDGIYRETITLRKKSKVYIEYNKGGCFPSTTLIATSAGAVSIGKLKVGESVKTLNTQTNAFEDQKIIKIVSHPPAQLVKIIFSNAEPFVVTLDHAVYTQRGQIKVSDLVAGDKIQSDNSKIFIVNSIQKTGRIEPVFNLITSGNFNFVADGLVVHNFSYFVTLRQFFWSLVYGLRTYRSLRKAQNQKPKVNAPSAVLNN